MTTTLTTPHPDVPLPAGAIADTTWADWNNKYRVIHTPDRGIDGHDCVVYGSALQFPDGRIDDGAIQDDRPGVWIQSYESLTTDEARALAALIVFTADEVDEWTQ